MFTKLCKTVYFVSYFWTKTDSAWKVWKSAYQNILGNVSSERIKGGFPHLDLSLVF